MRVPVLQLRLAAKVAAEISGLLTLSQLRNVPLGQIELSPGGSWRGGPMLRRLDREMPRKQRFAAQDPRLARRLRNR